MILEKGVIVPNALFEQPNDNIDVAFYHTLVRETSVINSIILTRFKVPTKPIAWPSSGLRRVSVNSFGFGGTNTHVILDDAYHYLLEHGLSANHCTVQSCMSNELAYSPVYRALSATNGVIHLNGTNGVKGKGANGTNGHYPIADIDLVANTNSLRAIERSYEPNLKQQEGVSYPTITSTLLVWSASDEKARE